MISIYNKKRNFEINITRRTITILISLLTLLPLITRVAGWSYASRLLIVSPYTGRCQQSTSQLILRQQASSTELDSSVPVADIDSISNSKSMATKTPPSSSSLETENSFLRNSILQLKEENENLKKYQKEMLQEQKRMKTRNNNNSNKIILESFEGEHLFDSSPSSFRRNNNKNSEEGEGKEKNYFDDTSLLSSSTSSDILIEMEGDDELWCDSLDGDQCPLEPTISFGEALRDRAYWLVGTRYICPAFASIRLHNFLVFLFSLRKTRSLNLAIFIWDHFDAQRGPIDKPSRHHLLFDHDGRSRWECRESS